MSGLISGDEFHVCVNMVKNTDRMKIHHKNLDLVRDLQKLHWELWYFIEGGIAVRVISLLLGMLWINCIWKRSIWHLTYMHNSFLAGFRWRKWVKRGREEILGDDGNCGNPAISKWTCSSLVSQYVRYVPSVPRVTFFFFQEKIQILIFR